VQTGIHFDIIGNMDDAAAVNALGALAQESRLAVYRLLVERGPEGYTAGEIGARLGIPAPTLSFHLKELSRAGLIAARRQSRHLHYSARFERMNALLDYLTANCCALAGRATPDCAPAAAARGRRRT
jgi:DNA-binding transcriptional ArsR family regulator